MALDQSACRGWGDGDSANPGPRRERAELRGGAPPPPPRPFEAGEIKIARSMQCVVPLAFWSGAVCARGGVLFRDRRVLRIVL